MSVYPVPYQERTDILRDYALVIIFVCVLAFVWVIFNEVVMNVGNTAISLVGETGVPSDLIHFIITIYRIVPIGMVIGVFLWVFLRATRKEPYQEYM